MQEWAYATLLVILITTPLMGSCTPTWVPVLTRWWRYATSPWWHPSPLWPRTKNAANQKLRMFAPWPSTCPLPTSPSARTEEYWWESERERGRDGVVVLTMWHLHVFFWLDIVNIAWLRFYTICIQWYHCAKSLACTLICFLHRPAEWTQDKDPLRHHCSQGTGVYQWSKHRTRHWLWPDCEVWWSAPYWDHSAWRLFQQGMKLHKNKTRTSLYFIFVLNVFFWYWYLINKPDGSLFVTISELN